MAKIIVETVREYVTAYAHALYGKRATVERIGDAVEIHHPAGWKSVRAWLVEVALPSGESASITVLQSQSEWYAVEVDRRRRIDD